ncbi:MAG: hypothetical protein H0U44_06820 [Flavisolibacter sp.]|jgi:hypothetical protein|nr:hypothetical protein [Flavisolibacter sp.]
MKKRLFRILNFFALNVLFFALYLNFIHKDNNTITPVKGARTTQLQQGATLVSNPEQYLEKGPLNTNPFGSLRVPSAK